MDTRVAYVLFLHFFAHKKVTFAHEKNHLGTLTGTSYLDMSDPEHPKIR